MGMERYHAKDSAFQSYSAELQAMIGQPVKLCEAMTRQGWPSDPATVESVSPVETFPLLIRWPNGRCLKVARINLES